MMKKVKVLLLTCCLLGLLNPGLTFATPKEVILNTILAWSEAWEKKEFERFLSYYSDSFKFDESKYNAWRSEVAESFKASEKLHIVIQKIDVTIKSMTAQALVNVQYKDTVLSKMGRKQINFIRENGYWKILSEHWKELETVIRPNQNYKGAVAGLMDSSFYQKISFLKVEKEPERLCVDMAYHYIPEITAREKPKPTVSIAFENQLAWAGPEQVALDGRLIKRFQARYVAPSGTMRFLLELDPTLDFTVHQIYDKARNLYCLAVEEDTTGQAVKDQVESTEEIAKTTKTSGEKTTEVKQFDKETEISVPKVSREKLDKEIVTLVYSWKSAWEKTAGVNGNFERYMSFYSDNFSVGIHDKNSWYKDKKKKNKRRPWIEGSVKSLNIVSVSEDRQKAKVRFKLKYKAPNYLETLKKQFVVVKENGLWKITSEKTKLASRK